MNDSIRLGQPPYSSYDEDINGEIQGLGVGGVSFDSELVGPEKTYSFVLNRNFNNSYLQLHLHNLTGDADLKLFWDKDNDAKYIPGVDQVLASSSTVGTSSEVISYYLPNFDNNSSFPRQNFAALVENYELEGTTLFDLDIVAVNTGAEQSPDPIALSDGTAVSLSDFFPPAQNSLYSSVSDRVATTYMFEVLEAGTATVDLTWETENSPIVRIFEDSNVNGIFDSDDEFIASNLQFESFIEFEAEEGLLFGQVLSPQERPDLKWTNFTFDIALETEDIPENPGGTPENPGDTPENPGGDPAGFEGRLDEALDFNPLQYLASHNDLIAAFGSDTNAATNQYFNFGIKEGRAADLFDEVRYLASNSDLISAFGTNFEAAVEHYVNFGSAEGRPTEFFDPVSYLANNADLRAAFGSDLHTAALHYIEFGAAEGRPTGDASGYEGRLDEVIGFDPLQYLASHDDLTAALGLNPAAATQHYLNFGLLEERAADQFDEVLYVASNSDLIDAFGTDFAAATEHYISFGMSEGRSTNSFDSASYLESNADLRAAFGDDLFQAALHYIQFGAAEGRPV